MKIGIDKNNKHYDGIIIYSIDDTSELKKGDVIYRKNPDNSVDVYPEFEIINNEYTKNIIDKLNEEDVYELDDLINQKL